MHAWMVCSVWAGEVIKGPLIVILTCVYSALNLLKNTVDNETVLAF